MAKKKEKKNILIKIITYLVVLIFFTAVYSHFIGTKGLFIREYAIINERIPQNFNGFKIVHFTDLHYGTTVKEKELKKLVNTINELKPDLVVFTGDLVDRHVLLKENDINILTRELNRIEASTGKYITRGNHDIHEEYDNLIKQTNFTIFNNQNTLIYSEENTPIRLVGLDDYLEHEIKIDDAFNYNKEEDIYTILLAHEPDVIDKLSEQKIDLFLSGHSHNGQIRLPFIGAIYTTIGAKKYYDEKYELNNTLMYISGGIGTSTAEFRLFVRPSINFYRLYTN